VWCLEVHRDDGQVLSCSNTQRRLSTTRARPRGAVGAFIDITERNRAERAQLCS
jgi:PAS domain S-box-containing protein